MVICIPLQKKIIVFKRVPRAAAFRFRWGFSKFIRTIQMKPFHELLLLLRPQSDFGIHTRTRHCFWSPEPSFWELLMAEKMKWAKAIGESVQSEFCAISRENCGMSGLLPKLMTCKVLWAIREFGIQRGTCAGWSPRQELGNNSRMWWHWPKKTPMKEQKDRESRVWCQYWWSDNREPSAIVRTPTSVFLFRPPRRHRCPFSRI